MIDPLMEIKIDKYGTTLDYCGCPDYLYRQIRIGGQCKHMKYLIQRDGETKTNNESEEKFNPDDFRGKGMDMNESGDKYTDKVLKQWSKIGRIFLDNRTKKWRILE